MRPRGTSGPENLFSLAVVSQQDVFVLRRQGRAAAEAVGMESRNQVRLATALSELGHDLMRSAPMTATFQLAPSPVPAALVIVFDWPDDREPTRESLDAARRLAQQVTYRPGNAAGQLALTHPVPAGAAARPDLADRLREVLMEVSDSGLSDDLRSQTRDLIAALEESQAHREELHRLNEELEETNQGVVALYTELSQELEETNRGVVALYAELDDKSRQLREAGESKTRFWSNVSHELRTPINSVVGLTRLLLDPESDPLTEEQRRQIGLISASGSAMLALVNELLDVAKAEAGRVEPQPERVDLRALLSQLRGIMRGAAPRPNVELCFPETERYPDLVTDESMLVRILRNLLSNGLKFTEDGEVRLDVRHDPERDAVVFTVTDTGVGIPEDQQARVFEEFYQVPGPHQRRHAGTGLGLPYAKRLSEILGGSLTLRSSPGSGTTMTLTLPAGPQADGDAAPPAPAGRLTVLLADDDDAFREVLRAPLERLQARVVEAADGIAALEKARRERPDLIMVDLNMPGADGYAVLRELAADRRLSSVPVVVVTSSEPSTVRRDLLKHARHVLSKDTVGIDRLASLLTLVGTERPRDGNVP